MSWPFKLIRISGHSMLPKIKPGDVILINAWAYILNKPQIGNVVVFKYGGKLWCKRIAAEKDGKYEMRGDNAADSKKTPLIGREEIVGKVMR